MKLNGKYDKSFRSRAYKAFVDRLDFSEVKVDSLVYGQEQTPAAKALWTTTNSFYMTWIPKNDLRLTQRREAGEEADEIYNAIPVSFD